jgi:tetratricopeptide (TPR) repeat protein
MNVMTTVLQRNSFALCLMLSACAAANPSGAADANTGNGTAFGAFLAAEYADSQADPATASDYYQLALHADPGNPILIDNGFISALLAGSPDSVALAREVPGNALATMLLGNQAAANGNFKTAEAQYAQLPQDSLSGLLKPLLLGWCLAGQGNAGAALNEIVPAAENSPFGAIYILNAALIADNAGDMKDAAQAYQAEDNGEQAPNLRLAQIMASWKARQGQTDAARAELEAMVATHPSLGIALPALIATMANPVIRSPSDGIAEAYLAIAGSLDQPSQALLRTTFLRFALNLRPDLSAARLLLADVQAGGDQPPSAPVRPLQLRQAIATLQPIPKTDPLYGPAVMQEADLLATLGQTAQAVALLDGLIALMPGTIDPLQQAGDILRENGAFSQSISYYNRAVAALPQPPPAGAWALYYDRGISKDQGGSWSAAEPDMKTALALAPNQPYVLNYIGYSWALRGENLPQAQSMLEQAVGVDPDEGAIIDSLGYVNLRRGNTAAALKLLTQAVQLDPDDAEVNAHLGDAFWAAGLHLQASYQWQRALGLQPDPKLQAQIEGKLKQIQPPA